MLFVVCCVLTLDLFVLCVRVLKSVLYVLCLVVGCSLFVVCHWLFVAVGCWLLVVGCLLPVASRLLFCRMLIVSVG